MKKLNNIALPNARSNFSGLPFLLYFRTPMEESLSTR